MLFLKIPRYMEDGNLRLRLLRMSDGPFILRGLNDGAILKANGLSRPIASSWFFVWWWMKKTFIPAYCIEYDSQPIGFIGLYNLIPGNSAEVSLVIFDRNNRRRGYGTRAFQILAQTLRRCHLIEKITLKIQGDNRGSISFWTGLGFEDVHIPDGLRVMSMDLKEC
ncbi:MAG TPA: hypothetical protein DCP92_08425 [Nitrospiraceae bacterium]|jgi:RimJ/RimL family protein N-acetyltransferase|nr:hypothetical protein [Nitrospiraceae bacterium]